MSDIEDGELLSSDNEENFTNQLARKEEKRERKMKNKDKNHLDTNNNHQNNVNEHRNFPRNNEIRSNKIKNTQPLRPHFNERKRNGHNKIDVEVNKKKKPKFEPKEKVSQEYCASVETELPSVVQNHSEIPVIPKRRILCKYYAGGECKNGVACVFMHQDFPCKFFHDKSSVCRAGTDCKYSHAPLSDDMQIVMDYFIQEGKEHKTIPVAVAPVIPSYNILSTVHNRTKCLLPTPASNNSQQNSGPQPYTSSSNLNLPNHEEPVFEKPKPFVAVPINNYRLKYSDPLIPATCTLNKPRNPPNNYLPKPVTKNYQKKQQEFSIKHFKHSTDSIASLSYENQCENYAPDFYSIKPKPISLMDIDFSAPPPCDIGLKAPAKPSQNLSYNNHAPARFIMRNNKNFRAQKPAEISSDKDFMEALKKLAAQVISEQTEQPLSPENQTVDGNENEDSPILKIMDEPFIHQSIKQENVPNFSDSVGDVKTDDNMNQDQIVETNMTNKSNQNPILETGAIKMENENSNIETNKVKQEKIEVPTVRIAEHTSILNINVNEMSESEKQYLDEMKSLINFDARFETKIRWVAVQLEPTEKQPYILYRLNAQEVHENASSDPRLLGHPVLRELENQNNSDEGNESQNSCHTSEDDDDYDVFHSKSLNIDLGLSSGQTDPESDTRSYLYDCKFKRKKISEQIML